MKLMAQQLLLDQVNDLEDKVKNIKPQQSQQTSILGSFASSKNSKPRPLKHCVVDMSIFLNHLNSVKKWIAEAKYVVIVPLEGKDKKKSFFFSFGHLFNRFDNYSVFTL